jgi:hypothetical protein
MEKIYISPLYLKILHLYFFANAIVSLTFSFVNAFRSEIGVFLILYLLNVFLSLYLSKVLEIKTSEKLLLPNIFKEHFIVAIFSSFGTVMLLLFFPKTNLGWVIISINYYILALFLIWGIVIKFGLAKRFFEIYNVISVKNVKSNVLKEFGGKLDLSFLEDYKPLEDDLIDSLILGIEQKDLEGKLSSLFYIASRIYLGKKYESEFYKNKLLKLDRDIQKILEGKTNKIAK